jgi:hypothetical protein
LVGGVDSTLVLVNFADWEDATVTRSGSNSQAITAITLATGKFAYKIEASRNTLRPSEESSVENGLTRYKHMVSFMLEGDDAASSLYEKTLGQGTYVAIVFTRGRQIKIFGAGTGLVLQGQTQQDYYANNAAKTLMLASDDEALEVVPPSNFIGTSSPFDFAAEKAVIEALIAA